MSATLAETTADTRKHIVSEKIRLPQLEPPAMPGPLACAAESTADRPIQQREELGEVPLGRRLVVGGGVAHRVAVGGPLVEL
jgi:hypothetical protein